jgi:hypothetical protein
MYSWYQLLDILEFKKINWDKRDNIEYVEEKLHKNGK